MLSQKNFIIAAAIVCILLVSSVIFFVNSGGKMSPEVGTYAGESDSTLEVEEKEPTQDQKENPGDGTSESEDTEIYSFGGDGPEDDRYKQIVLKYKSRFARLESEYRGKLNSLLANARVEFERTQEDGSKFSLAKLGWDYYKRGKALEKECDAKFYDILEQMEKELRGSDLPLGIVKEVKAEYEAQKGKRQDQLMSIAKDYI